MNRRKFPPAHPGEILKADLLDRALAELAQATSVSLDDLSGFVEGLVSVDADLAARLAAHFGTSAEYWLNLQATFDAEAAADRIRADYGVY